MVMNMENKEWEVKNNFLFEEKRDISSSLIKRIKSFYTRRVLNKTKMSYNKIKSTMDEPMFPF